MFAAQRGSGTKKSGHPNSQKHAERAPEKREPTRFNPLWRQLATRGGFVSGSSDDAFPFPLQAKLTVSQPQDPHEQEAEHLADRIAATPTKAQHSQGRNHTESEPQPSGSDDIIRPDSAGSPLPPLIRARVESALGADLSGVRVHSGFTAHALARDLRAQAFTHGEHIWLGAGRSANDLHLMTHESVHTLQQRQARGGVNRQLGRTIFRHPVSPTPAARLNAVQLFGDGTPANPGKTLREFEAYTRLQADWFTDASLTSSDRDDLWSLLFRTRLGPHFVAGVGDLKLADLRTVTLLQWLNLTAFCRACHPSYPTVRVDLDPTTTLARRIDLGSTLLQLETLVPREVLQLTVSEQQLADLQAGGAALWTKLSTYWTTFSPHLQMTYSRDPSPGSTERGEEFQHILDLVGTPTGITPFLSLLGKVRNLHRFTVATLTQLVTNFADTSRRKPVHLVLVTGHDESAFQKSAPLFEDLVVNSPNLVLMLEGQMSLATMTTEIPNIARTYGQPDAGGVYRIGQVMIAGHGEARSVQMAGTGVPSIVDGRVEYPSESLNLDTNAANTTALLEALFDNLDPATARIVFAGCLVGSTRVPAGLPAADIVAHFANPANQSLGRFTEQRGVARGFSAGFVQAARADVGLAGARSFMDAGGNLALQYPIDADAFGSALSYVATGREPTGLFRAAVEVAATTSEAVATAQLQARLTFPARGDIGMASHAHW
jgi:hypothetical protein